MMLTPRSVDRAALLDAQAQLGIDHPQQLGVGEGGQGALGVVVVEEVPGTHGESGLIAPELVLSAQIGSLAKLKSPGGRQSCLWNA
jgi:hypothetical protein